MLYFEAGEHVLTWKIWQRTSKENQGQPLGFWSQDNQGSEGYYTPTKKRDFNRLWGDLICLRSCRDRSMSPLGTVISHVTLAAQRTHLLNTSRDQCYMESGVSTDYTMSSNRKIQFTKNSGRDYGLAKRLRFWSIAREGDSDKIRIPRLE